MNRWRTPALVALWLQVAALFGVASYALTSGHFGFNAWITGGEAFLAALVLWWWTQLFGRLSRGQGVPPTDGVLRSFAVLFPILTIFRACLWGLLLLGVLGGAAPEANSVALTALFTLWGAAIFAGNAMYGHTLNVALEPGNLLARTRLLEWLNVSAALSLGMTVLNLVPIKGYSTEPANQMSQLVYGVSGVLDVVATVLALLALLPRRPEKGSEQ
ncbi:hypothetical protein D3875_11115 [Deinococcus cavernae]|uniref:Uncharacterized protein n=1 Tax=Deinococcus cavernae TaxID=2320857 RepID=A0A418V7E9_9DEIO|nr:hypothetical protein [Deinococcus cavernae]RJF72024.1 hypothetical protein D3875_11115 [Deinococcus cavernae]